MEIQYITEVTAEEFPFPEAGEQNKLKAGMIVQIAARSKYYVVTKVSALRRALALLKKSPLLLIHPTDEPDWDQSLVYEAGNALFPTNTYVGIIVGKITIDPNSYDSAIFLQR